MQHEFALGWDAGVWDAALSSCYDQSLGYLVMTGSLPDPKLYPSLGGAFPGFLLFLGYQQQIQTERRELYSSTMPSYLISQTLGSRKDAQVDELT